MMKNKTAQVIVPRPIEGALTYSIPDHLESIIRPGSFVWVPFHRTKIEGLVESIENQTEEHEYKLKDILDCPFDTPLFTPKDLEFFKWIAEYYQLPPGEVFRSALPKSILKIPKRKSKEIEYKIIQTIENPLTLTNEQNHAFIQINKAIDQGRFHSFLLHGITGSGKTELYLQSAQRILKLGKSVIILVPEISLTPQLRERFEKRFGDKVAVLHSGLTEKNRREFWWKIHREEVQVVVGARSALFAPVKNLGLMIVDEEHETSYKQEDHLRYNARDLALVRSKINSAITILGSATPSIETYHAALNGKHELLTLNERPGSSSQTSPKRL
jgi:primosomal protein N' (replication factor Y)